MTYLGAGSPSASHSMMKGLSTSPGCATWNSNSSTVGCFTILGGYQPIVIKKQHSFYACDSPRIKITNNTWKSDVNILQLNRDDQSKRSEEYYKKYELDEIPVKDDCSFNDHSFSEGYDSGTGDNKDSITNSDLDKLELKIMTRMSQELLTDTSTVSSLDSNLKLFKTTVQQIFDNFHDSMCDFEDYKKRFNEIMQKNKGDSVTELEEFIGTMLHNIRSSEMSVTNNKTTERIDRNNEVICPEDYENNQEILTVNNSSTDINGFEYRPNSNTASDSGMLNTCLVSEFPCLEVRITERNIISERNFREPFLNDIGNLASADNIKILAAKNIEIEKYTTEQDHYNVYDTKLDRDIPVKNSCAMKDIHLNENFVNDKDKDENKFFMFKICSYICKKLRKM
ncbi:hypothetical protein KGM_206397 [Danaus plexippus plexippus]|uniref:Uncharacterized protein n=1 Tax=Danaus plexippus plexippus TaxID=278856 RepID=A0A212EQT0_DANPL|nr:hypothetical protein KGM_206397 [Danaus plexippus plexippus]